MTAPHVPSKASVERCARAIRNTFETDDDREFGSGYFSAHAISEDDVSAWSEAVLRCAVEECGYVDNRTMLDLIAATATGQDMRAKEWKERAERAEKMSDEYCARALKAEDEVRRLDDR